MPALARFKIPALDNALGVLRGAWDRLAPLPGGKRMFSQLVGMAAPYTGSIGATITELRHGYAQASITDRRAVRNHLASVHAIAMANLAEMTASAALAYTTPDDGRFIITGLSIDYEKKARGTITATAECGDIDASERVELTVPVVLTNPAGETVANAQIRALVGPKRPLA